MKSSEIADFYRFLQNEEARLQNLFIIKWNNIFAQRKFDTLDLLDLIELSVQIDYFNYLWKRLENLFQYLHSRY